MDPPKPPPVPPAPRPPVAPDDGLEFEITDFADARRVLDNESMSQFDVVTHLSPSHWHRLRRKGLPTDRALTGRAIDWLLSLPPTLRPQHLGRQFPRIANALAEVWHDPAQCNAALDKLMSDGRKGRKGFPAEIRDELVALRGWTQTF
jgi:hypothetical protein